MLRNFLELITYILSLISFLSINFYTQSNYGSIGVLFAYILLPVFLQKFKAIGVYVIALKRTLLNSTKLFPVFLIIFIGFILSFKVRTNFGVQYSESDSLSYSIIRTVTMVIGELDTSKMGLDDEDAIPNLIIYFLFIGLMCTILLNLFVGIAVDDIKTILDEADIQLISMQIRYVLRIQKAIQPINNYFSFSKKILNMNFKIYNDKTDNKLLKLSNIVTKRLNCFAIKEDQIILNLADPNKRLENILLDISREINEKIDRFKQNYSTKLNETECKLLNAQTRLQDSLNEFSSIALNQISTFRDEMNTVNKKVNNDLDNLQTDVHKASQDIAYTKKYFNTRLAESEQKFLSQIMKLESILIDMTRRALFQFESVKESIITEPKNIKSLIKNSEKVLEDFLAELVTSNQQNATQNDNQLASSVQNEMLEKLIKPGNEELKLLINNMLEKTIEKFRSNETSFYVQKLQLESMSITLRNLFIDSLLDLKAENKSEFEKLKIESLNIEKKLNAIELRLCEAFSKEDLLQ